MINWLASIYIQKVKKGKKG